MDEQNRDGGRDDLELDAWPAMEPPDGFADQVMRAWSEETRPEAPITVLPDRRRWGVPALSALAGAAAASLVFLLWPASAPDEPPRLPQATNGLEHDTVAAANPNSNPNVIAMGDLGSAICEGEARIDWMVEESGTIRIQQDRGEVLYNLKNPSNAVVHTPSGDVEVNGNLFRVVVDDEVAPAQNPTATRLTVLEGSGYLSNDNGAANLEACETGEASADETPTVLRARAIIVQPGEPFKTMPFDEDTSEVNLE